MLALLFGQTSVLGSGVCYAHPSCLVTGPCEWHEPRTGEASTALGKATGVRSLRSCSLVANADLHIKAQVKISIPGLGWWPR